MDSNVTYLHQDAFSPDPIIGLLEVDENSKGCLAFLEAVQSVLDISKQLVLRYTSFSEACLHVVQYVVGFKPVIKPGVHHYLSYLTDT